MNINNQKIKYLNLQLLANFGFIIALIVSFLLTYDKKLSLEHKRKLFTNDLAQKLVILQSSLVFIISITYLYINYNQYKISKTAQEKEEEETFLFQIETSIFAIISAIIGLYIVYKSVNNQNLTINETEVL